MHAIHWIIPHTPGARAPRGLFLGMRGQPATGAACELPLHWWGVYIVRQRGDGARRRWSHCAQTKPPAGAKRINLASRRTHAKAPCPRPHHETPAC